MHEEPVRHGRARGRRSRTTLSSLAPLVCASALLGAAPAAHAFCGFYVSGAGSDLFNSATQVVLMRQGTRTVLSMQNDYQGPPEDFALVVPVPTVLQEDNVKTLPRAVFEKLDQLDAPRLVEYWEQDPCSPYDGYPLAKMAKASIGSAGAALDDAKEKDYGVTVEAEFTVAEYQIVILSARDSTGLDSWLRDNHYKIPKGAAPHLAPYVQSGMKFFVAKVDASKVSFHDGRAVLSPLRFHYDSDTFSLPVRLGLINAKDTQDLIVHVLSPDQRYEVANRDNVTIPTNLEVKDAVRGRFGAFYAALFDRTVATHPLAVVTEYSWDAASCDPCPIPPLEESELSTLGSDVLPDGPGQSFVLTRLHTRYSKDYPADDLVFRTAPAIVGGREEYDDENRIEKRARPDDYNNFQARYIIRHEWQGPIECEEPQRGIWGPPPHQPGDDEVAYDEPPAPKLEAARDLAFAPRDQSSLGQLVGEDVPEIGLQGGTLTPVPGGPGHPGTVAPGATGCGCRGAGATRAKGGAAAVLIALLCLAWERRRRRSLGAAEG